MSLRPLKVEVNVNIPVEPVLLYILCSMVCGVASFSSRAHSKPSRLTFLRLLAYFDQLSWMCTTSALSLLVHLVLLCSFMNKHTLIHLHTYTHTHVVHFVSVLSRQCTHYTHSHIISYTHTHIHTHTHTHTHIHTLTRGQPHIHIHIYLYLDTTSVQFLQSG